MEPAFTPAGTQAIAAWASSQGLPFLAWPEQGWFRQWEPFDTLVPAAYYLNSVTRVGRHGQVVLVEPWTEEGAGEPMERTVLAFASYPGLRHRAAARVGEHFITRVAFLESRPPPAVQVGDALWDRHATTLAPTPAEAAAAFHPELRRLLAGWGFRGHLELRPGGLVVHYAGLGPIPAHYERLVGIARQIAAAASRYPA
ncbi:MAG: hypothetical protein HY744_13350 [Deltaproteobacteria bacterium]|nr:hypothetical protein [Deltaproteobacteria bacterium]